MSANAKTSSVKGVKKVNKYLKEIKIEVKKVHWPSRKELAVFTGIVLASIFTVGVFFWILDLGFSALLRLIIR